MILILPYSADNGVDWVEVEARCEDSPSFFAQSKIESLVPHVLAIKDMQRVFERIFCAVSASTNISKQLDDEYRRCNSLISTSQPKYNDWVSFHGTFQSLTPENDSLTICRSWLLFAVVLEMF